MACVLTKPIVGGLEEDLEDRADVVRFSVASALGREIARRYDVESTPTFLVFDAAGTMIAPQVGLPNLEAIKAEG